MYMLDVCEIHIDHDNPLYHYTTSGQIYYYSQSSLSVLWLLVQLCTLHMQHCFILCIIIGCTCAMPCLARDPADSQSIYNKVALLFQSDLVHELATYESGILSTIANLIAM